MPNQNLEKSEHNQNSELQFQKLKTDSIANIKKNDFDLKNPLYGMSLEEYIEGKKYHKECFDQLKTIKLEIMRI